MGKGANLCLLLGCWLSLSLSLPLSHLLCVMMIGEYAGKYITSW